MTLLQVLLLSGFLLALGGCGQLYFQASQSSSRIKQFLKPPALFIQKAGAWFYWVVIIYLGITLLIYAGHSFSWPKVNDVAFLYYLSWLINEHDYKPYLQLFDTSFPGTFLIHALLCKVFGYSDLGFHILDIIYLGILLMTTWFLLKSLDRRVAAMAALSFGLYYLNRDQGVHLQRDYLAILPIAISLVVAQGDLRRKDLAYFLIGFLFSVSATIKPHFLIGLPVVMIGAIFIYEQSGQDAYWKSWSKAISFTLMGSLTWLLITLIWLSSTGSLGAFIDMASHYLPLYMSLDGGHQEGDWHLRWLSFLQEIISEAKQEWILACVALTWGLINMTWERKKIILILMLLSLMTLYVVYVFLGGKGWDYHWMPFKYLAIICTAFFVTSSQKKINPLLWIVPATLCGAVFIANFWIINKLFLNPANAYQRVMELSVEHKKYPYRDANTDHLMAYLKTRTQAGDHIELRITGTTGPFFNTMLDLQLLPVSSYPLQLMFYRTTNAPYIIEARKSLLQQLTPPPKFILDDNQFSFLANPDGSPSFPEYEDFLKNNYSLVYDNKEKMGFPYQFLVYERVPQ